MVWSGRDEAGALGDGDQRADVVEEVDEEEDEDDLESAHVERAADVEVEGGGADGGRRSRVHAAASAPGGRRCRAAVVPSTPMSMEARMRKACRTAMSRMPKRASRVAGACRLPRVTVVAGLGTMMPALRRPMKAMKRPMPPATAAWSW